MFVERLKFAWRIAFALALIVTSFATTSRNSHAQARSVVDATTYEGADRQQRLQEGPLLQPSRSASVSR